MNSKFNKILQSIKYLSYFRVGLIITVVVSIVIIVLAINNFAIRTSQNQIEYRKICSEMNDDSVFKRQVLHEIKQIRSFAKQTSYRVDSLKTDAFQNTEELRSIKSFIKTLNSK